MRNWGAIVELVLARVNPVTVASSVCRRRCAHRRAKWHHNWSPEDFLAGEKSSAGQDEMTVRREHATATLVTERLRRSGGSPYTSDLRFIRTSACFA